MFTNFHTHTYLCKHAEGTVADYVAAAVSDSCSALGFSDHCPYPDDGIDTWPEVRMTPKQAEDYVADVRLAASNADFSLYLGFECEYDSRYKNWYAEELKGRLQADYLVLGPHWISQGNGFVYAPRIKETVLMHRYFDCVIEAIESGLFNFVAHPDLIMADGRCWTDELAACFRALIDAAVSYDLPLEINGLGLARELVVGQDGWRHPYPVDKFWQIAKEKGAKVICNADAHRPQDLVANVKKARGYAENFGFLPIENIFHKF
ncbi:MAG: histidinol-phosphatase [Spirochaetaceae bacterium]|nr:histidinol-phosphatase [Spirochaetaceae bacterium]